MCDNQATEIEQLEGLISGLQGIQVTNNLLLKYKNCLSLRQVSYFDFYTLIMVGMFFFVCVIT